jgi:hypothetical protein
METDMLKQIRVFFAQMLSALAALTTYVPEGFAKVSYGTDDQNCLAFNGMQPFADNGYTLSHISGVKTDEF